MQPPGFLFPDMKGMREMQKHQLEMEQWQKLMEKQQKEKQEFMDK
jgi:hypothetical protein